MTDMIRNLSRREPRYRIVDDRRLTVTIKRIDGTSQPLAVEVINISAGGAKFRADQPFVASDVMSVAIRVEHPAWELEVAGEVVWVAPSPVNDWTFGCKLDPPIPEEALHDFARHGILDRREHPRDEIDVTAVVRWELDKATTEVRLTNYSPGGGFCMQSACSCRPGERLLVQIVSETGREVLVPANARWQVQSDDHFLIGCEFVRPKDSSLISEVISGNTVFERGRRMRKSVFSHLRPGVSRRSTHDAPSTTSTKLRVAAAVIGVIFAVTAVGRWWLSGSNGPAVTQYVATYDETDTDRSQTSFQSDTLEGPEAFYSAEYFYLQGDYTRAVDALRVAVAHDRGNPLSIYLLALTHYQMNRMDLAERCVAKGVELEQSRPIEAWTQAMRSFQGPARIWLDQARQQQQAH